MKGELIGWNYEVSGQSEHLSLLFPPHLTLWGPIDSEK